MYGSWYIKHVRQNFLSFWAISSKSKFWKNEKSSRKCFHLHKCTINDNHMIYGSWDINCNRQIFLVIFGFFCPFTPQKWKYHKLKKKKHLETSSFYTSVPKIMVTGYTVSETWFVPDVIVIFHIELFFTLSPH